MRSSSARAVLILTAAATLLALGLTACSGSGTRESVSTLERTSTVARSPSTTPDSTATVPGTAVTVTIGDTTLRGRLWDNPAARDLATRLPLTLTSVDYNAVEKTASIDPALTMDGMPAGDDPEPGEIGWYAPTSDLVLYYGDVGYWNGIARLGTFDDAGIDLLAAGPRDVTVTIAADEG